jgi:hypothetical protein
LFGELAFSRMVATGEPEGDRDVLAALARSVDDVGGLTLLDNLVRGGQDEFGAQMRFRMRASYRRGISLGIGYHDGGNR